MRNIKVIRDLGYVEVETGEYRVTHPLVHRRTYSIYKRP